MVEDREGFDFLGFHHRRVVLRKEQREKRGILRWPSRKAQARFRERVRQVVGPPGRLRAHWSERMIALRKYLQGYCQYYRHGQSTAVFRKLDQFVQERVARTYTRSQPTGKKRKRRNWRQHREQLRAWGKLPSLVELQRGSFRAYRSAVKVRWRAV